MGKRILVTGGAGYVGRTLIRQLYTENQLCVPFFGRDYAHVQGTAAIYTIHDNSALSSDLANRYRPER